jgi:hypothetical protein
LFALLTCEGKDLVRLIDLQVKCVYRRVNIIFTAFLCQENMKASLLFVLWLWIVSHLAHGGNDTPASWHLRHREIQVDNTNTRTVSFLLVVLILFFNDERLEVLRLQRERRRCRLFPKSSCICSEGQLVRTIRENREARICVDTNIKLTREIDITGKNFTITCTEYTVSDRRSSCKIVGRGGHRLFKGSPTNATFLQIELENGSAEEGGIALLTGGLTRFEGGRISMGRASRDGGAIRITGGTLLLFTELSANAASGNGGAVCASGSSTNVMIDSTIESEWGANTATNGGAVSVVDGAQVQGGGRFSYNIARENGGAFYIRNTTVNMWIASSDNKAGSKGGSLYVKSARLNITYGSFFGFDSVSGSRRNNLWIDDDDNPSENGSLVFCSGFVSYLDIEEIATGPNQTQKFNNTNCKQRPPFVPFAPMAPSSPFPPAPRPAPFAPVGGIAPPASMPSLNASVPLKATP